VHAPNYLGNSVPAPSSFDAQGYPPEEPREKLELFPTLGCHFIIFRTAGSRSDSASAKLADEGIIDEANVYVVVFREGICLVC
jgi:hypothetical protein